LPVWFQAGMDSRLSRQRIERVLFGLATRLEPRNAITIMRSVKRQNTLITRFVRLATTPSDRGLKRRANYSGISFVKAKENVVPKKSL